VKNLGFFEIYGVSTRTREEKCWVSAEILAKGSIFCDFLRTFALQKLIR